MTVSLSMASVMLAHRMKSDPLKRFKCSSQGQRDLIRFCGDAEVYAHAAVRSGKTTGGAALSIALLRGLPELDGIALPRIRRPAVGALIVPSYKQAAGSSIQTYRELIGDHPHKIAYVSTGLDYVGAIYIKPDGAWSNLARNWSKLYVFTHDGELPEGLTLDLAHGDEPPPERMWRAIRFRKRAGYPFIRFITGTPMERFKTNGAGWEWLMRDNEFKHCLGKTQRRRRRIQWGLKDNTALSDKDIKELYESAVEDPHERAKLDGEHVDATGRPPWPLQRLDQWLKVCVDPIQVVSIPIEDFGTVEVEIWEHVKERAIYYSPADLSSGTVSREHDPLGFHVVRDRKLVARCITQIPPYILGRLHAKVGKYYNEMLLDPENNSGWIKTYLQGVLDEGYNLANVSKERFEDKEKGGWSERYGFNTNETSRKEFVGAIQRAIKQNDCTILSREVLGAIRACTLDGSDKVQWAEHRGEDVIISGRWLYQTRKPPEPEENESVFKRHEPLEMVSAGIPAW